MPSWLHGFIEWAAESPQMMGLLASLFGTQFLKTALLPKVYDHKAKASVVRSIVRGVAFALGAVTTYGLWDGDPRHGVVWAAIVGFGAPTIYRMTVSWRAQKGDKWAQRMRAEDAILRHARPPEDDPAADDETTVMGSRGRS